MTRQEIRFFPFTYLHGIRSPIWRLNQNFNIVLDKLPNRTRIKWCTTLPYWLIFTTNCNNTSWLKFGKRFQLRFLIWSGKIYRKIRKLTCLKRKNLENPDVFDFFKCFVARKNIFTNFFIILDWIIFDPIRMTSRQKLTRLLRAWSDLLCTHFIFLNVKW